MTALPSLAKLASAFSFTSFQRTHHFMHLTTHTVRSHAYLSTLLAQTWVMQLYGIQITGRGSESHASQP